MQLDSRLKAVVAVAASAGLLVALTAGGAASSAGAATLPNCAVAKNLEAIIDDSGSMNGTDPDRFRASLVDILATFNTEKKMGAVQFGSDASPLFLADPIGPNLTGIRSALNLIQGDDGGTDYEAGFNLANTQNPSANARVFLSDGEPNSPPNPAVWTNPKIKSYVVGFGTADPAVLNQIASDTGGPPPFNITDVSDLKTVAMIINARINCEPDPLQRAIPFTKPGQTKRAGFNPSGPTAELLASFPLGDSFKVLDVTQGKGGAGGASIAKSRGPKVKVSRGAGFVAVKISRLKKGKVRFKIRAKKLPSPTTVKLAIIR